MGIKQMNRYLIDNCSKNAICKSHLKIAEGKTIVIDTSIYMYKYMTQNALIEYIYLMISILLEYNITPIFIFDGKAPLEKKELLRERSRFKKDAEKKYNQIQKELERSDLNSELKKDMTDELESLKKKFIRIKEKDIFKIKALMDAYGITYMEAEGEADKLCATMVKNGRAWACLSDDMDMFVYGCSRVMRHLSLLKHTIIMYDFDKILNELSMSETQFREIMVLSGTDYNIHQNTSLFQTLNLYYQYSTQSENDKPFYNWLIENTNYITDYEELMKVYDLFCISQFDVYFENVHRIKKLNFAKLVNTLKEDGFVLC
jgi:uncharacterized membrane protein YheB (UPF0754 family)